jgi:hypothetical protein
MAATPCVLCNDETQRPSPIAITVTGADLHLPLAAHLECLRRLLLLPSSEEVAAPAPSIPRDAACSVCTTPVPHIGHHPYTLTFTAGEKPERHWIHAGCMPPSLTDAVRR